MRTRRLLAKAAHQDASDAFEFQCLAQTIRAPSSTPTRIIVPGWYQFSDIAFGAQPAAARATQENLLMTFGGMRSWVIQYDFTVKYFSWTGGSNYTQHVQRLTGTTQPFGPVIQFPQITEEMLPHGIVPALQLPSSRFGSFNWLSGATGYIEFNMDFRFITVSAQFNAELPENDNFDGSLLFTQTPDGPECPLIFNVNSDYYLQPIFNAGFRQLLNSTHATTGIFSGWSNPVYNQTLGVDDITGATSQVHGFFDSPPLTAVGVRQYFPLPEFGVEAAIVVNKFQVRAPNLDGYFTYENEDGVALYDGNTGAAL